MEIVKKHRYLLTCLLMGVFCLFKLSGLAYANGEFPEVSVSASVELEGSLPATTDTFEIVLEPEHENTPMPAGDSCLSVSGSGNVTFDKIVFSSPGIYQYTLKQNAGDADCEYDERIYHLKVYVMNGENGLETILILYENDESEKLGAAKFVNRYKTVQNEDNDSSDRKENTGYEEPKKPSDPTAEIIESSDSSVHIGEMDTPLGNPDHDPNDDPNVTSLPKTGVDDYWHLYALGIIILLIIAGKMIQILRSDEVE